MHVAIRRDKYKNSDLDAAAAIRTRRIPLLWSIKMYIPNTDVATISSQIMWDAFYNYSPRSVVTTNFSC
jgi:hypothetical protein